MTTNEAIDKHELTHLECKLSYRDTIPENVRREPSTWFPRIFLEKYMEYETLKDTDDDDVRFDKFRLSMDLSDASGVIYVLMPMLRSVNTYGFPYKNNGIFVCTEMTMCVGEHEHEECETNIAITEFDKWPVEKAVKMHHPISPGHISYVIILRSDEQ